MLGDTSRFDVVIVGAGLVGTNTAFWLSEICDASVLLVDMEAGTAFHQSSRNTCGVHRPVHLQPGGKDGKWYAKSYDLWHLVAQKYDIPWRTFGRLNYVFREEDASIIEEYAKNGVANGMSDDEMELLDGPGVSKLEPEVKCVLGLHVKKESMSSYGDLCNQVYGWARENGVKFARGMKVRRVRETPKGAEVELQDVASGTVEVVTCSLLINASGAAALRLARMVGLGKNFAELHMRGAYWVAEGPVVSGIKRNLYPLTSRHAVKGIFQSYSGPHLVTKPDGFGGWRKELGPSSAPVLGAFAYQGISEDFGTATDIIFRRPIQSRIKTFTSRNFLAFAWKEWRAAISKGSVTEYLKQSIPNLDERMVVGKGFTGVAWVILNSKDNEFLPHPTILKGPSSMHVLYSGGSATGSPAFCAGLVSLLKDGGYLDAYHQKGERKHGSLWDFESTGDVKPE